MTVLPGQALKLGLGVVVELPDKYLRHTTMISRYQQFERRI
jgi:hypothetical protein